MVGFYWLFSYVIGCFMTAYLVGKWKGVHLQQQASGNLGARNAGRVLGKSAFIWTMIGDGLKGVLVVGVGYYLQLAPYVIAIGMLLVVIGHIYPFWLKFKGGKGVATGIGSLLLFSPLYFFVFLGGFLLTLPIFKSTTMSMLVGFVCYIFLVIWLLRCDLIAIVLMLLLIIWKHRENVRERVM